MAKTSTTVTTIFLRGQKEMLDVDLAEIYGIETKRMKEAVRRNAERFPPDFIFEITREEYSSLRTQFATLENTHDAQLNGMYEAIENLLDDKVDKQTANERKRIGIRPDE